MNKERIQKIIAAKSEYSRRKAEQLIIEGKVYLNGKKVTELGVKASYDDEIVIDGKVLFQDDLVYYLLNKPVNVISSTNDEKNRDIVVNYVPERPKVYPVGRLDYNTTGLLLLTNDGELANALMHPSSKINKTYQVTVKGNVKDEDINNLRKGVDIDGYITQKAWVKKIKYNLKKNETKVEITIHEGKNRQIRRMFDSVGYHVVKLKRTKYAFLELQIEKLPEGAYRELKLKEIQRLHSLVKEIADE